MHHTAFATTPEVTQTLNFKCVRMKHYGDLYMRQGCPDDWPNADVRNRCQSGATDRSDPLGSMPVTSSVTGVTYRNYFCAACNSDSSAVEFWKPRLECVSLMPYANQFKNYSIDVIANHLVFNEDHQDGGTWGLYLERGGVKVSTLFSPLRQLCI